MLSNSVVFQVSVPECIEAGLGSTVMLAGETSSVPVRLLSTTALTNMSFNVIYPTERFDTNFVLAVNSPQVLAQRWSLVETGQIELSFTLPATSILYGPTNVGQLGFRAVSHQSSAFVSLQISNVHGLKPNGSEVANANGYPGRVVVIGAQPLLEAVFDTNHQPVLVLYAQPGTTNMLQYTTALTETNTWTDCGPAVVMTNLFQVIQPVCTNRYTLFYRARREP
jgi:hypothetical protein